MSSPALPRARVILTAGAGAIGGAVAWWRWGGPWLAGLAIGTAVLLLLAIAMPRAYAPVFALLDGIVRTALQAFTWLVLGIVFVVVFIPGRVVLALRCHDPLQRRPDAKVPSYWCLVEKKTDDPAQRFRTQF